MGECNSVISSEHGEPDTGIPFASRGSGDSANWPIWVGAFLVSLAGWIMFVSNPVPAEDAAMLFRYSDNVAAGLGIVYNPGGTPVDGATDMLFMLVLAALHTVGPSVNAAAAAANALSLGLMTALVMRSWRVWGGIPTGWTLIPAASLLVGPAWIYGSLGFGTLIFAASCASVAASSEAVARRPSRMRLIILGFLVVVSGLIRPEGFFLAPLIVLAQAWRAKSWRLVVVPAAVWLPGVMLFVSWRWSYFGFPLPNPFYKKGGGAIHPIGLVRTAELVMSAAIPVTIGILMAFRFQESRRRATSLFMILGGWACAWLLIADEMNIALRFQYAVLPVLSILTAPLFSEVVQSRQGSHLQYRRGMVAVLGGALALGFAIGSSVYLFPSIRTAAGYRTDPGKAQSESIHFLVASLLSKHSGDGSRRLATTEAGYVAWKSGWKVTDLWGLNDKSIAHNGFLSPGDLERLNPEVVFAHVPTSNRSTNSLDHIQSFLPRWAEMTEPLLCYTAQEDYVLLGQWGNSRSFVVLARPDAEDLQALRDEMRTLTWTGLANTASSGDLPTPESCT